MEGELKISVMCPVCKKQTIAEEVEHTRGDEVTGGRDDCLVKTYHLHSEAHIHCSWCKKQLSIKIREVEHGFSELQISC